MMEFSKVDDIILVCLGNENERLKKIIKFILENYKVKVFSNVDDLNDFNNEKIIFAISIDEVGMNFEYYKLIGKIRKKEIMFKDCIGGIIVDGDNEMYTKSVARELVFSANENGCAFAGRSLVEATKNLQNFDIRSKNKNLSLMDTYFDSVKNLIERVTNFEFKKENSNKILVLHSSHNNNSNSMGIWKMVKNHLENLQNIQIKEISLRNGTLLDCRGCPYEVCMHFSQKGKCYYGGVMVEEVYPAILESDILVVLAPNYNDALSGNIMACINRLTSLFRSTNFCNKAVFSIVVSGYSGGDIVAKQLISSLNMNKSFALPPNFTMVETANLQGSFNEVLGIEERAKDFSNIIKSCCMKGEIK